MVNFDRIVQLAKERDITLAQLSRAAGKSARYLPMCISRHIEPPPECLEAIADKLGTSVEYLQGETDIIAKKPAGLPDRLWENIISDDAKLELANWIAKASDEDVKVFLELARRLKK